MGLAIIIPILRPLNIPGLQENDVTKGVFDCIDKLPERSVVLISFDFDPAAKPELYPAGLVLVRHAFKKNLRVIGMTLVVTGVGMAHEIMTTAAKDYGKEDTKDYVFLGWKPGGATLILGMGESIAKQIPTDWQNRSIANMPVMEGVKSLKDVNYLVCLSASAGVEGWVLYAADKYKIPIGGGCTMIVEPILRTWYQSGQITGIIGGMRGAAEYEKLLKKPDKATGGMDSLSIGHFLIIFLILLSNIVYFLCSQGADSKGKKSSVGEEKK